MSINKLLLWEKYRPKTMEDIILLPRIRERFKDGVSQHYIFHGSYGTGKTSLARILIGKYTKQSAFLELNSSFYTSIDILRTEIEDFCKFMPMIETESEFKYVFLDEMDRTSPQFQDAFKAFIEKYSKNIIFIISTNHINKISDGIKSRFVSIDFDCQNIDEEKFIKQEIYKKLTKIVLPQEKIEIPKPDLVSIITKKFPDLRSIIVDIQDYSQTGMVSGGVINNNDKLLLFNLIYDKYQDYESIYHFLMSNFGPEKIDVMINMLGRPFIDWSISEKKNIDKLFECNYIIADYTSKLETNTDPVILGMTIVGKFRDILL